MNEVPAKVKYTETESWTVVTRGGDVELLFRVYGVSVQDCEKVLELETDGGDGCLAR